MSYSDIVATVAMIVAFVAVPASAYLSYHYAIKGERRKEYNSVVFPVRTALLKQIYAIRAGEYQQANITLDDIFRIQNQLGEKLEFFAAYQEYLYANSRDGLEIKVTNDYRQEVGNTSIALSAAEKLLDLIPLR
ncbi:hypothetical protein NYD00_000766 [Salmonella enterica subsp. enterica]|nr:hypothetical protein [Salmonella enterica subsp. enterica serovar Oranienburg]EDY2714019.1 hypothetical protein [Salmonella enterica]EEB9173832.1 hypothetical protein [Salmonella enterica subsp. enterica serovar Poona]EJR2726100.1 hypothetical protein [Salmonella enterica subsp. enterica]EEG7528037.1 hypothetical protein [Salmonella enterica]